MNYKKYIAAVMALSMATGVAGCGSSSDSSSKAEDDFSATENVAVADTESIEAIPEGAEKEILYLGEGDLNPTKGSPEKSTELQLFESKGGKIRFQQTSNEDRLIILLLLSQLTRIFLIYSSMSGLHFLHR